MKVFVQFLIKIVVAVGAFYFLLKYVNIDFSKIKVILSSFGYTGVLFAVFLGAIASTAARWQAILSFQSVELKTSRLLQVTMIGISFNLLVPGSVGGDAVKAYVTANLTQNSKVKLFSTVIFDRLFGIFIMMLFCLFGFGLNYAVVVDNPEVMTVVIRLSYIVLALFILGMVFNKALLRFVSQSKIFTKVKDVVIVYLDLLKNKKIVLRLFLFSCLNIILVSLMYYLVFRFYSLTPSFKIFLFCVPIGLILMSLPISPGGLGVGQVTFFYLFNFFSDGYGEIGIIAVTMFQVIMFFGAIIGLGCFLALPLNLRKGVEAS